MRKLMYKNSEIGGGGGSGNFNVTELTQAEYNALTVAQKSDTSMLWVITDAVGSNLGEYIGSVKMCLQNSIPDGWLSCENGQEVLRSAYPELWAWVQTDAPLITEAQWQTKAAAQKSVGYYSDGDGSTTFRLPRLVGFFEGTTAANVGAFTGAGLPNISGSTGAFYADFTVSAPYGAFAVDVQRANVGAASGTVWAVSDSFDASRSSAIYGNSNTVQPESVGLVWCVRAFGAAVNQGTVDITALAQSLNLKASLTLDNLSQAGEDHFLERDFTIIYPNGGSESSPANVAANSRYVMDNPFLGYIVKCEAEIYDNNQWGATGWYSDAYTGTARSVGVKANQLNDDSIVVQTGLLNVASTSSTTGSPFGRTGGVSSAPCRVKVWKIGKISI